MLLLLLVRLPVGQGAFSPYGVIGFNAQRVANTLKANPGTTLTLNAISLLTGIPGLSLAFAVNSIFGTPNTNTSILQALETQVVVIAIMQVKFLKY
jgi:hypothetical protein